MQDGTLNANSGKAKFSRGLQHHQRGELEFAEDCYREAFRLDPRHTDALHLMGVIALQQGRHDESIDAILRALSLKPDTVEYHVNLATAFRARGDSEKAISHYRQALKLNPDFAIAHNNLGNALMDVGQPEEAVFCFRRALELFPEMTSARENLPLAEAAVRELHKKNSETGDAESSLSDNQMGQHPISLETEKRTVLHVGCGFPNPESLHEQFRGKKWQEIRLDINPDVQPDVLASLTDMSAVDSNTMDAVWSSHNIEHLYAHEVPIALGEFLRVLKPGGLLLISLPDLQQIAHYIVADQLEDVIYQSAAGPITARDCVFGYGKDIAEGNFYMAHKTGFTPKTLRQHLVDAGFEIRKIWTSPFNIWAEALKPEAA
ncbi:MAG: hypothetical protein Tsb009_34980 [Planctomycetaceae bacterium]